MTHLRHDVVLADVLDLEVDELLVAEDVETVFLALELVGDLSVGVIRLQQSDALRVWRDNPGDWILDATVVEDLPLLVAPLIDRLRCRSVGFGDQTGVDSGLDLGLGLLWCEVEVA